MIPQWLSRLARRTYKQYCAEECEGREFDPPLGNSSFFVFFSYVETNRALFSILLLVANRYKSLLQYGATGMVASEAMKKKARVISTI